METLRRARKEHASLPILLVTAFADIREAVGAMRDGAVNYLSKPIDLELSPDSALPIGLVLNQDFANFARSRRGLHQPGLTHLTVSPTEECRIVNMHKNLEQYLEITPTELQFFEEVPSRA